MLTPATYGFGGFTSSAYYWLGIAGNFAKLAQPGPVVEASWMSGFQANFSFPLSNLGKRPVDVYSNVKSVNRFSQDLLGTIHVIPLLNKRALAVPLDATWVPYQ